MEKFPPQTETDAWHETNTGMLDAAVLAEEHFAFLSDPSFLGISIEDGFTEVNDTVRAPVPPPSLAQAQVEDATLKRIGDLSHDLTIDSRSFAYAGLTVLAESQITNSYDTMLAYMTAAYVNYDYSELISRCVYGMKSKVARTAALNITAPYLSEYITDPTVTIHTDVSRADVFSRCIKAQIMRSDNPYAAMIAGWTAQQIEYLPERYGLDHEDIDNPEYNKFISHFAVAEDFYGDDTLWGTTPVPERLTLGQIGIFVENEIHLHAPQLDEIGRLAIKTWTERLCELRVSLSPNPMCAEYDRIIARGSAMIGDEHRTLTALRNINNSVKSADIILDNLTYIDNEVAINTLLRSSSDLYKTAKIILSHPMLNRAEDIKHMCSSLEQMTVHPDYNLDQRDVVKQAITRLLKEGVVHPGCFKPL